jgi:hypothetical protein
LVRPRAGRRVGPAVTRKIMVGEAFLRHVVETIGRPPTWLEAAATHHHDERGGCYHPRSPRGRRTRFHPSPAGRVDPLSTKLIREHSVTGPRTRRAHHALREARHDPGAT